MTPPESVLRTAGLRKNYGAVQVLQDVDFTLPAGARQALIGPNGAGKTSLINLLTGFVPADAGRIFLNGAEITRLAPADRAKRGLARTFQINSLFPALTPLESVTLALAERDGLAGRWYSPLRALSAQIDEAHALLTRLGLAEECGRPTRTLAYGKQRLLEIALALATRPRVLLLDEPAAGVPTRESAELFAVLADLPRDIAVLFIEHDMDLVFRFAERITVLVAGAVLCEGPPALIADDPRVRAVYLGHG